jgi:FtsH-binding integral membrane protein
LAAPFRDVPILMQAQIISGQLAFPILECFHIAGFALSIGMTALVDFRLLGFGLRDQTPAQIATSGLWWSLGGLVVAIFSGMLIFSTDPDMYYLNWIFDAKMVCLVLAIVFHYTIHRKALQQGASANTVRWVAVGSLALWLSVVFGGIFIAILQH